MALVDSKRNTYLPDLTSYKTNHVINLGSVTSVAVVSRAKPLSTVKYGKTLVTSSNQFIYGPDCKTTVTVNVNTQTTVANTAYISNPSSITSTFVAINNNYLGKSTRPLKVSNPTVINQTRISVYVRPVIVTEANKIYGYNTKTRFKTIVDIDRELDKEHNNSVYPFTKTVIVHNTLLNKTTQKLTIPDPIYVKSLYVSIPNVVKTVKMPYKQIVRVDRIRGPKSNQSKWTVVDILYDVPEGFVPGGGGGNVVVGDSEYWS